MAYRVVFWERLKLVELLPLQLTRINMRLLVEPGGSRKMRPNLSVGTEQRVVQESRFADRLSSFTLFDLNSFFVFLQRSACSLVKSLSC